MAASTAGGLRHFLVKDVLGDDISGLRALVLGRSNIVGKPMANLLLAESCTVTIAHSRTRDLPEECRRAHIWGSIFLAIGIALAVGIIWALLSH